MTLIRSHRWLQAGAFALAFALTCVPAGAQQPGATRGIPAPMPSPPPAASSTARAAAPAPGGETGLRQRVEQLEEQLVDMQVVIGTLESLARGAPPPPSAFGAGRQPGPSAAYGAAEAGRLDSIETQIRALGAQMEQLQEQLRDLASRPASLPPPESLAAAEPASPSAPPLRPQLDLPETQRTGFGSVTVSPDRGQDDQIGRVLSAPPPPAAAAPPPPSAPQTAALPPADAGLSAKQLYEQAYGYLLQRDYGAAEQAFETFLSRHGKDPLAGSAQYWLGESLYVRGQYRAAAGAFLKGYQNYARSPKAPESLLKLAMSLQRLGQKDAACSSYSELTSKFPTLPGHVKSTAQSEQRKAGC